MDYKLELEKMRENFEQNRPGRMRLHRPWWMFADEELSKLYSEIIRHRSSILLLRQ